MDIVTVLILMAVLYLVPELLRKKKKVKYEYPLPPDNKPPVPKQEPPVPKQKKTTVQHEPKTAKQYMPDFSSKVAKTVPAKETAPAFQEITPQPSGWKENLNQAVIINGFIFSQILEPPRSRKVFYYQKK